MKIKILLLTVVALFMGNWHVQAQNNGQKILVVYYSWGGNTRALAQQIKTATNADILEVVPQTAYPSDYDACVDQAKKEIRANYRPAIKTKAPNLKAYDIILVGTPNWWSTMAPPIATFLANNNFSGKKMATFVTHGGGGMANCESDMKKLCPQASFLKGYKIYGNSSSQKKTETWLRNIGILK